MFNGDCYPNGSYINHIYITPDGSLYISHLQCVLPDSTLSGGEWVNPNGQPVNCGYSNRTNPLRCDISNTPSNITVYRPAADNFHESDFGGDMFKCCLPNSCSDPTTNIITVHIFSKLYLIVLVHTVICYRSTIGHVEIINFSVVELPSNITVVPQHYKLQCVYTGWSFPTIQWYYNNNILNCASPPNGYSCVVSSRQTLFSQNETHFYTLDVTWSTDVINSQSNNNGDHVYRCYVAAADITRNRYLTVTGKYFYYYSYMMSQVILLAPGFIPSPPNLINKTATTITVNWTPVSSDADGYVVNATSNTHTVTQQVKGGSQNETILKGLIPETTYDITVRAYQDILGPASNAINIQTLSSGIVMSKKNYYYQLIVSQLFHQSIGHLCHPLLNFKTLNIILIV